MNLIDADKLKSYIDQINSFATNRSHAIRADGEDPSYFDGIRQYTEKLNEALENGQFDPDEPKKESFDQIARNERAKGPKLRANAMDTSWDAAISQTPEKTADRYRMIYSILTKRGPKTDDEIRHAMTDVGYAHSWSGVSVARMELQRAGWVKDSGEKRLSDAGRQQVVWAAVPGA